MIEIKETLGLIYWYRFDDNVAESTVLRMMSYK